jgi:CDGSH-type Zn-finger protein/uncharacterized Fe-S cluster protein YjdI
VSADSLHRFKGRDIEVTWSKSRCIHFAACVRALGAVFEPGRRPWVIPDAATASEVAEVVRRCPAGALHYHLPGGPAELPEPVNKITPWPHGPLYLRGNLEVVGENGAPHLRDTRVALCRCGNSANKPFCDGSHVRVGFRDPGNVFEGKVEPAAEELVPTDSAGAETVLKIRPIPSGPLRVEGPFTLAEADGDTTVSGRGAKLCRCGQSRNKPFCDGSHLVAQG